MAGEGPQHHLRIEQEPRHRPRPSNSSST
jgi:hypothetical protein